MLERARTTPRGGILGALDLYLLGVLLLVVFIAQLKLNNGIASDGALYFAHLRSLVFDHDLQIDAEIRFLGLPARPHHVIPIGPTILWAPLYLLVALGDWIGARAGLWTRESGVALGSTGAYVQATFLVSFATAAAGIVALHLRLRREFGGAIAFLTSVLILGATTLAWYIVSEPSMTHAASFGMVALALVCSERWLVDHLPTRRQAITLGVLFALVVLVRIEDGLFLLFPACALAFGPAARSQSVRARTRVALEMLVGAAPFIVLQALMYAALFASNQFTLVGGEEGYLLISSRWSDVLFSSRHGLFSWTPAVWLGVLGTLLYVRRNRWWAIPALVTFAIMVWLNGSARDWSGGWAFGGRRFTSALAALAPGFAAALDWARRHPLVVLVPAVAVTIGWNTLLMTQFQRDLVPKDEAVRFDKMVRQQADLYVKPPYFYPFAFPANVWFAWREGLPIDKYDLLGAEPFHREMYLPLNEWGSRFLTGGWDDGAGDRFGSRHYLNGATGTILVPLDVPSDLEFSLDIEARAEGAAGSGTATLGVAVNDHAFGDVAMPVGGDRPVRQVFTTPAHAKVWRRGYNRVTISRRDVPAGVPVVVYALRLGPVAHSSASH
jgi:hypothetical protein